MYEMYSEKFDRNLFYLSIKGNKFRQIMVNKPPEFSVQFQYLGKIVRHFRGGGLNFVVYDVYTYYIPLNNILELIFFIKKFFQEFSKYIQQVCIPKHGSWYTPPSLIDVYVHSNIVIGSASTLVHHKYVTESRKLSIHPIDDQIYYNNIDASIIASTGRSEKWKD